MLAFVYSHHVTPALKKRNIEGGERRARVVSYYINNSIITTALRGKGWEGGREEKGFISCLNFRIPTRILKQAERGRKSHS